MEMASCEFEAVSWKGEAKVRLGVGNGSEWER